jgi:hypothetical protein
LEPSVSIQLRPAAQSLTIAASEASTFKLASGDAEDEDLLARNAVMGSYLNRRAGVAGPGLRWRYDQRYDDRSATGSRNLERIPVRWNQHPTGKLNAVIPSESGEPSNHGRCGVLDPPVSQGMTPQGGAERFNLTRIGSM